LKLRVTLAYGIRSASGYTWCGKIIGSLSAFVTSTGGSMQLSLCSSAALVGMGRANGVSGYIGDGSNRWLAVHRLDSAHLFRLALEDAPAGSTLHAVAEEGVPIRAIAEVISRHLDVPVASISAEDAGKHFGFLAGFIGLDSPASIALTRELLVWHPTQPGLIDDLDKGHYFDSRSA
jgi:nucleoside-diphosphate-sugar epimerase